MATNVELRAINDFVASLSEVTDLHESFLYGIDKQGNSIKVAVEDISELDDKVVAADWLEVDTGEGSGNVYASNGSGSGASSEEIEALRQEVQMFARKLLSFTSELNGKSNVGHKHDIADVSGLQAFITETNAELQRLRELTSTINSQINGRIDTLRENLATTTLSVVELQKTVAQIRSKEGLRLIDNLETYEGTDGEIVMYTGATTDKYENGFTYQAERGTFTLPSGTEYIEVNNDYPNTVHGIYAKTGETLEDISCNITDYISTLGDGKTYKSVDYDILQIGDKVWDTDGNLYTINEKTDFGNLTLDNGTIITRNNTTESFSKAVVYTSPTSGEKIYKVTAAPLYLGTLRGTSLYGEGIGYYFDGSCTENVATETMIFETLSWNQKNNQPDFREWFEWNNI